MLTSTKTHDHKLCDSCIYMKPFYVGGVSGKVCIIKKDIKNTTSVCDGYQLNDKGVE